MNEHLDHTIWEKKGTIGILNLHNPPENYIETPEFVDVKQLESWFSDKTLKGILIRGSGRHFSAGADLGKLKELAKNETRLVEHMNRGRKLISRIEGMDIPVIAVIRGACFGAGLEIALSCHIRICSDNSLFAFPEVNHGLIPGLGGAVMLTRLVGPGKATEVVLSGDVIDARRALELKLTDYIVPGKDIQEFAMRFIKKLTSDRDIDVIHSVMQSIRNAQNMSFDQAMEEETKLFCSLAVKSMHNKKDQ